MMYAAFHTSSIPLGCSYAFVVVVVVVVFTEFPFYVVRMFRFLKLFILFYFIIFFVKMFGLRERERERCLDW